MREESAAGVPLFMLLAFVALEGVASRRWMVALCVLTFGAFLGFAIWLNWPKEDHRGTIRRTLKENPELACPMCGLVGKHKRDCPVR